MSTAIALALGYLVVLALLLLFIYGVGERREDAV